MSDVHTPRHHATTALYRGRTSGADIRVVQAFARGQRQIKSPALVPDPRTNTVLLQEAGFDGMSARALVWVLFRRVVSAVSMACARVDCIGVCDV